MKRSTLSHNDLLDLFYKSNSTYLTVLDENFQIIEVNTYFNNQFSIFGKNIVGRSFSDIIYLRDFLNYKYLLEKSVSEGKSTLIIDLRMLNNDGEGFTWSKWEFQIIVQKRKKILVGHGHSILKKQDHYLEIPDKMNQFQVKNEVLYGLFQDHLLGFWLWDLEQKQNQLSASLYSLLGYEPGDIGREKKQLKWEKHIYLPDKAKVEIQLRDHFSTRGKVPFHSEFRILSLKKEIKHVVCYGKVVKWTDSGSPSKMVGGLFDISEKKNSEAIIEKQNVFLKELTFNQSHLMRAKLANILGVLEVMDGKRDFEEITHLIGLIKNEAIKLDKVLQDSIHTSSALNSDNF